MSPALAIAQARVEARAIFMSGAKLDYIPPLQGHDMVDEPSSLLDRMKRQERALSELRQDTTKRFGEMREHNKKALDALKDEVHKEFGLMDAKLDRLISKIDEPKKLTKR